MAYEYKQTNYYHIWQVTGGVLLQVESPVLVVLRIAVAVLQTRNVGYWNGTSGTEQKVEGFVISA